jgi:hypothetical protein
MALDYDSFDQSVPNGGWRAIVDDTEAGKVLDAYNVHNSDVLKPWQKRIIKWHAGQAYGFANLKQLAINRFKKSYNPEEAPDDRFGWNLYVEGSVAFLEQDMTSLVDARDRLKKLNPGSPNTKILESFVRCFKKPYREAYNPECK